VKVLNMWAIKYNNHGYPFIHEGTVRKTKAESIEKITDELSFWSRDWKKLKKDYSLSAIKVIVTEKC